MMIKIDAAAVTDFLSQHEVDEPIVINRQGTPHAVMVPYEIFQIMHRNNRRSMSISRADG